MKFIVGSTLLVIFVFACQTSKEKKEKDVVQKISTNKHEVKFPHESSPFKERNYCSEIFFFRTNRDEFRKIKSRYIDGLLRRCRDGFYLDCFMITVDTTPTTDCSEFCTSPKCKDYAQFMEQVFFRRKFKTYISKEKNFLLDDDSRIVDILNNFSALSNNTESPEVGDNLFSLAKYENNKIKEWNSLKIHSDTTIIELEKIIASKCACDSNY